MTGYSEGVRTGSELARHFPLTAAYLAQLPDGASSYPECVSKGAIIRRRLQRLSGDWPRGLLPSAIEDLLANAPASSAWLPSVHQHAATFAYGDVMFDDDAGGAQLLESLRADNQRLLTSRLYRIMFALGNPTRVLRNAEKRWRAFHRGTKLRVIDARPASATLRLEYPAHLYHPITLRGLANAYEVVLAAAGATTAKLEVHVESPTAALVTGGWT